MVKHLAGFLLVKLKQNRKVNEVKKTSLKHNQKMTEYKRRTVPAVSPPKFATTGAGLTKDCKKLKKAK